MEFKPGELFVCVKGDKYEIGMVKRPNNDGTGYFCYYHSGETAANTPTDRMHKLINAGYITKHELGGQAKSSETDI